MGKTRREDRGEEKGGAEKHSVGGACRGHVTLSATLVALHLSRSPCFSICKLWRRWPFGRSATRQEWCWLELNLVDAENQLQQVTDDIAHFWHTAGGGLTRVLWPLETRTKLVYNHSEEPLLVVVLVWNGRLDQRCATDVNDWMWLYHLSSRGWHVMCAGMREVLSLASFKPTHRIISNVCNKTSENNTRGSI